MKNIIQSSAQRIVSQKQTAGRKGRVTKNKSFKQELTIEDKIEGASYNMTEIYSILRKLMADSFGLDRQSDWSRTVITDRFQQVIDKYPGMDEAIAVIHKHGKALSKELSKVDIKMP